MVPSSDLVDTYEQFMGLSQKMLGSGHYEVAFHALQAATHCAEDLKDEQRLIAIQQAAEAQQDLVDTKAPSHWMSTKAATS